jgi:PhnB protein
MATAEASAQATTNPPVLGGVVPYLTVGGAVKATTFYARAFGATEMARHPPDEQGRTMHVHLHVNGGSLMLSDPFPEYGHPPTAPQSFSLMLPVDDIEAW